MPTISIFIRKDDLPIWQALENKSAWLSDALNFEKKGSEFVKQGGSLDFTKGDKVVSIESLTPLSLKTKAANGLCKVHGLPLDARGRCLQKGCKYS